MDQPKPTLQGIPVNLLPVITDDGGDEQQQGRAGLVEVGDQIQFIPIKLIGILEVVQQQKSMMIMVGTKEQNQ